MCIFNIKIYYVKLNIMGCDYYIQCYLEIEHQNGISYYELPIIRGYFSDLECGFNDSDDDEKYYNTKEFQQLYDDMKKLCLTSRKPVIIYSDNNFTSGRMKEKYLPLIENKINGNYNNEYCLYMDTGPLTNINQIIKVTKKEIRYQCGDSPLLYTDNSDNELSFEDY